MVRPRDPQALHRGISRGREGHPGGSWAAGRRHARQLRRRQQVSEGLHRPAERELMDTGVDGQLAVELRRVVKRFGATVALRGVDLSLKEGEIHCMVGENGAGKSTLTK